MATRSVKFGNSIPPYVANTAKVKNPINFTVELFISNVSQGFLAVGDIAHEITFSAYSDIKFRITPLSGYFLNSVSFQNTNNTTQATTTFNPIQDTYYDYTPQSIGSTTTAGYHAVINVDVVNADGSPIPDVPTEMLRDFMVGNYSTGAGVISQNGDPTYTAFVDVTKPTGLVTHELVLGVKSTLDLLGATAVKMRFNTLPNNKFIYARTGGGSIAIDVPFTDNSIEVDLTQAQWEASSISRRQFVINTRTAITRTFYFGNDVDATGKPIKTGNNSFTGVVTLYGQYDPDYGYPEKTYNVESGTELDIVLSSDFDRGKIELTIVDGFEFIGVNFPYEATFTNNTVSYTFPSDSSELDPNSEINRYYIATTKATGNPDPEPSDEPETIANNYLVTKAELEEFNKEVYSVLAFEQTENVQTLITEYISAIRVYPFKLPPDNLYNRGKIKIKRSELNTATIINSDIITVNLGNINIPRTYNNALDFINVKPELILPFCNGSINIDPEYILGSTVNIQMKINIINGATTINLKSDKVDGIFTVSNTTIGADYPFYNRSNVLQKVFEPNQAINNILTAYVIVESPIYTDSKVKSKKEGLLTDVKGDVIVDDIKMNVLATSEEKAELISLLKNGVFIK